MIGPRELRAVTVFWPRRFVDRCTGPVLASVHWADWQSQTHVPLILFFSIFWNWFVSPGCF